MCEKNCMTCMLAKPTITKDGHKHWRCASNGYTVNARMHCEEWTNRYPYPNPRVRNFPVNKQSMLLD